MVGACSSWFDFVLYLWIIHCHCCWKRTGRKYDTAKDLQLWCRDEWYLSLLFVVGACSPRFDFVIYLGMIHHHCCWKHTDRKYDTVEDLQLWCRDELYPSLLHMLGACSPWFGFSNISEWFTISVVGFILNFIWAFCLSLTLAHPDLILFYISAWFTILLLETYRL